MMKKIILIFTFFVFFNTRPVYGAVETIRFEKVNPGNGLYYDLKRLKEKFTLLINIDPKKKTLYYLNLVDIRLAELAYIVKNKDINQIETGSQRYETTVGEMTNLLKVVNDKNLKDKATSKLESNGEILDELLQTIPYEDVQYLFMMNDINSNKLYLSEIK